MQEAPLSPEKESPLERGEPTPECITRRGTFRLLPAAAATIAIGGIPALLTELAEGADNPLPSSIYLIRHGEKPLSKHDRHLSAAGWARAAMLAREANNLFPGLRFVFATNAEEGKSCREMETARPLSRSLGLAQPDCAFAEAQENKLADFILGHPATYGGGIVLIVWHHTKMPELVGRLGYEGHLNPPKDDEFDTIWRLTYAGSHTPQFQRYRQPPVTDADRAGSQRFSSEFGGCSCNAS
jgi:phosphohistidine phosphatase SixA